MTAPDNVAALSDEQIMEIAAKHQWYDADAECYDIPAIVRDCLAASAPVAVSPVAEGEAAGAGEAVAWMRAGANSWHGYEACADGDLNGFPVYRAAPPAPKAQPVAYSIGRTLHWHEGRGINDAQLYAAPKASAQALTDVQITMLYLKHTGYHLDPAHDADVFAFARALGIPAPARMNDDKQEGAA